MTRPEDRTFKDDAPAGTGRQSKFVITDPGGVGYGAGR